MAKNKKHKKPTMAEQADRHVLYEQSVQNVEYEVEFAQERFKELKGRKLKSIREDFAGTAAAACAWVAADPEHTAIAVDIDADVMDWGRKHHYKKLKKNQQKRMQFLVGDVRTTETPKVDAIWAFNFSYWHFRKRQELIDYFKKLKTDLVKDGVLFLDAFGGYEAYEELEEETEHDDFTYVWEQAHYNPISGEQRCHIHFRFPDGSALEKAFSYTWRLYSMPEITEMLEEAGFKKIRIYMQGWDEETDEETDDYFEVTECDADPGWIAYVIAEK